jgi:hypothetical protein
MEVITNETKRKNFMPDTHVHELEVQLNGQIICRLCGEFFPYMEMEICKVDSANRVQHVMEEIAVAGKYMASSFQNGIIVYSRIQSNGLREELTASKISKRSFKVYKKIYSGGEQS